MWGSFYNMPRAIFYLLKGGYNSVGLGVWGICCWTRGGVRGMEEGVLASHGTQCSPRFARTVVLLNEPSIILTRGTQNQLKSLPVRYP